MRNTLVIIQAPDNLAQIVCKDSAGQTVLILDEEDIKRMPLADLEPSNPDDVFAYANHLLGECFNAYLPATKFDVLA
jgi:hypothetical protein